MLVERVADVRTIENQALDGLLLAPIGRGSIYLGKLIANLVFVGTVELIGVPLLALFFNVRILPVLGPLILPNLVQPG